MWGGSEAIADQGVQNQIKHLVGHIGRGKHASGGTQKNLVLPSWNLAQAIWLRQAERHLRPLIGKMPPGANAAPAIAASACEHKKPGATDVTAQKIKRERRQITAGIFHHLI